ncbi:MAG: hypothetical protein JW870_15475 [Candidatus Delongbacteria bacterium]|nr:hypothetical protein [Candidatus Delongbacteria bacterium]MBN2817781.1 hypothetical protein [Bacteroidales bacterium]
MKYIKNAIWALCFLFNICVSNSQNCLSTIATDIYCGGTYYWNAKLMCENTPVVFGTICSEWIDVDFNINPGSDFAIRMDVIQLDPEAGLCVLSGSNYFPFNWQKDSSYVFRPVDKSSGLYIEFIGPPSDYCTTSGESRIKLSYYNMPDGAFKNFQDSVDYVKTIIMTNKQKYLNNKCLYFFQDLSKYSINVESFYYSNVSDDINYYDAIQIHPVNLLKLVQMEKMGYKGFYFNIKLKNKYPTQEINDALKIYEDVYDGTEYWNSTYSNLFKDKIIEDIELIVF